MDIKTTDADQFVSKVETDREVKYMTFLLQKYKQMKHAINGIKAIGKAEIDKLKEKIDVTVQPHEEFLNSIEKQVREVLNVIGVYEVCYAYDSDYGIRRTSKFFLTQLQAEQYADEQEKDKNKFDICISKKSFDPHYCCSVSELLKDIN